MELTEKQLDELEEWAGSLFSPAKVALIMDLDERKLSEAIASKSGMPYRRYMRGKLMSEGKIRKAVFEMAAQGSNPAQTLALDIMEKSRIDEHFE